MPIFSVLSFSCAEFLCVCAEFFVPNFFAPCFLVSNLLGVKFSLCRVICLCRVFFVRVFFVPDVFNADFFERRDILDGVIIALQSTGLSIGGRCEWTVRKPR